MINLELFEEYNPINKVVKKIFMDIKNSFDINKLEIEEPGFITKFLYEHEGIKIISVSDFRVIIYYELNIDGEEIECSSSLKRKIFNFFSREWKKNKPTNKMRLKDKSIELLNKFEDEDFEDDGENDDLYESKNNSVISNIFNTIKKEFDINNLHHNGTTYPLYEREYDKFIYDDDGYNKIIITRTYTIYPLREYELTINNKKIKCSYVLKHKIFEFFNKKYKEKRKEIENKELDDLNNRFTEEWDDETNENKIINELNQETYRNAANKLNKKGFYNRSKRLMDYSKDTKDLYNYRYVIRTFLPENGYKYVYTNNIGFRIIEKDGFLNLSILDVDPINDPNTQMDSSKDRPYEEKVFLASRNVISTIYDVNEEKRHHTKFVDRKVAMRVYKELKIFIKENDLNMDITPNDLYSDTSIVTNGNDFGSGIMDDENKNIV